jgi:hypothetical protein
VLNAVDSGKFPLLVSRMAQGMQVSDDAFSKDELLKLEASLQLDEPTLKQLLDSITLVLTQVRNHCNNFYTQVIELMQCRRRSA